MKMSHVMASVEVQPHGHSSPVYLSGIVSSFNRGENWDSDEGTGLQKVPQPENSSVRTGNHLSLEATWRPVESVGFGISLSWVWTFLAM